MMLRAGERIMSTRRRKVERIVVQGRGEEAFGIRERGREGLW